MCQEDLDPPHGQRPQMSALSLALPVMTALLAATPPATDESGDCKPETLTGIGKDCGKTNDVGCLAAAAFVLRERLHSRIETIRKLDERERFDIELERALMGYPSSNPSEKLVTAVHVSVTGLLRRALYNDIRSETKRTLKMAVDAAQQAVLREQICKSFPTGSPEQAAVSSTIGLVSSLVDTSATYFCSDTPLELPPAAAPLSCTQVGIPILDASQTVDFWIKHKCLSRNTYSKTIATDTFRRVLRDLQEFRDGETEGSVIQCQSERISKLSILLSSIIDASGTNSANVIAFLREAHDWATEIAQARVSGANAHRIVSLLSIPDGLLTYYSATDLSRYRCGERYAQAVIEALACRGCAQNSNLPVPPACSQ